MKNFALIVGFLMMSLILIPNVIAIEDSSVTLNINYFANYDDPNDPDSPDMSDEIFLGDEGSIGFGEVEIDLSKNGRYILDDVDYNNPADDVPGLYVFRGEDKYGHFIQFNAYGGNSWNSSEDIKFEILFDNARTSGILDVPGYFEEKLDGECGIIEGNPELSTGDDEWYIELSDDDAQFCSSTNVGNDRVRVYFMAEDEDDEGFVNVEIDYFENYDIPGDHTPNMTDEIYIGQDRDMIGFGEVYVPLTLNGEIIVDPADNYDDPNDDVSGLHILRGQDAKGNFIQFNARGSNDIGDKEELKFNVDFGNAEIVDIEHVPFATYETQGNGVCSIIEGQPGHGGDDEWYLDQDNEEAEFCTTTGGGDDRVRVYYELEDNQGPILTNIETNPNIPLTVFQEEKNISISFDSNEYPINVQFRLLNSSGQIVEIQGDYRIESPDDLPLVFTVREDLEIGDYELWIFAEDDGENVGSAFVGDIFIEDERKRNGGGDDGGSSNREITFYNDDLSFDVGLLDQGLGDLSQDPISLNNDFDSQKEEDFASLWLVGFLAIDLIILILILIVLAVRR